MELVDPGTLEHIRGLLMAVEAELVHFIMATLTSLFTSRTHQLRWLLLLNGMLPMGEPLLVIGAQ